MGASDSKLTFKQGIFKLSEQRNIPADDPYWRGFWELPESAEDVFSLFSPIDVRRTRDTFLENLETLLLAVTSRLVVLRNHPSFPNDDLAPERDALNCIRVLTRILPYIYEAPHLDDWEAKFFWGARRKRTRKSQLSSRSEVLFDGTDASADEPPEPEPEFEDAKPLAEELIDTLIDLLFYSEFTIGKSPPGKQRVSYAIWQSGVGCNTPVISTKEFESNRTEIMRLLLVLTGKSMYMNSTVLSQQGVKAISYITTCPDKQIVLSVLCSMLNTTLKYNPATWRVPYDHVVFKDSKQLLVAYCLQLLLVLAVYPVPETGNGPPPKNFYRHFLGRLHRPQDFQFLVDGMMRILNQPLQATSSYLPGSQKSITWAPEMVMLFWETLQCNKRFRSFLIDTDRAHDFVILMLFYIMNNRNDPSAQGVLKMCVFILQTLSTEPNFGKGLNKVFEGQDTLPQTIRIPNFHGSYADYLITMVHALITTSKGKLDTLYSPLLAVINNIAPYLENLGRAPSSKLLQLYASMSAPSFLLANETNHVLLHSLLEAMNAIIEHKYEANPNFVYAVYRSKRKFEALRAFTLESGREEIEKQNRLKKERAASAQDPRSPVDSAPNSAIPTSPTTSDPAEAHSAFAIGDDEDEEGSYSPTLVNPSNIQSATSSRAGSVSSPADTTFPLQLRGMSEKARGKRPAGQPAFSRQSSTTSLLSAVNTGSFSGSGTFQPTVEWIEQWLPQLPLHTILTLISQLSPHLPSDPSRDIPTTLIAIRRAEIHGIDPSPPRVHSFEWSSLSLGWYQSLLWGFVFTSELTVSKGPAGVWNGTGIRLFRVQETAAQTPSLLAPRGAVDAVGSNLVSMVGNLNLRGGAPQLGQGGRTGSGGGSGGNGSPMTVRDV
ncbi:hypothetical protein P152DRAFT_506593 [Eremomyces bilateralis CBS 781.70]|uniref:High-temperature-induced dauer-formation protein n=1 Tax=Eremomyces bilateralis CBS 781.70 TaxID=1392243 RepID=A0A6G1G6T0_9PEZI|nr:uncharacterized protein P152DRAFT_506593 [Eremomyces bilateralis CBS 781.70]KAF1813734.1 hypothetical protein P152DRAFT_506593 [Eremomyces bilateralis CBS 781.70]